MDGEWWVLTEDALKRRKSAMNVHYRIWTGGENSMGQHSRLCSTLAQSAKRK